MKRNVILLVLAALLLTAILAFSACGGDSGTEASKTPEATESLKNNTEEPPTEKPSAEPTEEPTAEPTEEPTEKPTETSDPTEVPDGLPIADIFSAVIDANGITDGSANKYKVEELNEPKTKYDESIGRYVAAFDGGDKETAGTYVVMDFVNSYNALEKSFSAEVYCSYNALELEMYCMGNLHAAGFGIGMANDGDNTTLGALFRNGDNYEIVEFGETKAETYYHCVITFDGKSMSYYFDGKLVGTKEITDFYMTDVDGAQYLAIGADCSEDQQNEYFYDGNVAIVNIYSTALTAEQVTALYNALPVKK